jgi:hypothetical protein
VIKITIGHQNFELGVKHQAQRDRSFPMKSQHNRARNKWALGEH